MPSVLHGPNPAARALADYEDRFKAGEEPDSPAENAFNALVARIQDDPEGYVADCVADPSQLLAHILRTCASSIGNEAEAGRLIMRSAFLPHVNGIARYLAEKR